MPADGPVYITDRRCSHRAKCKGEAVWCFVAVLDSGEELAITNGEGRRARSCDGHLMPYMAKLGGMCPAGVRKVKAVPFYALAMTLDQQPEQGSQPLPDDQPIPGVDQPEPDEAAAATDDEPDAA